VSLGETSNLYTGFVALIHRLLAPGGELVAITPRSSCNGPYFQPFREGFLQQMSLRRLPVLGVTVSTGRVVDFRLREALRQEAGEGAVPLLYPCHFNGGKVHWPKPAGRKPNAIVDTAVTRPWLVPSGTYLLTKRFTSKEERRRLVACLFDPELIPAPWIGIGNHLNYFHADGAGLDRELALGLFVYLISTLVDDYFRRFSGHTQVNATDLRKLPYRDRVMLTAMGKALESTSAGQEAVDRIVRALLLRWLTSRGNPRFGSRKSRIT
jgi:adenine-specific DNA-methyltransferase